MDDLWEALIEISKTQVVIANAVLRLERELVGPDRPQQEPSPGPTATGGTTTE